MDDMKKFLNFKEKNRMILKLVFISFLICILLIPLQMISGIIEERQATSWSVKDQIIDQVGGPLRFAGPVLTVPYLEWFTNSKGKAYSKKQTAHFLPEKLNIAARAEHNEKHRGIYFAPVFSALLDIKGTFSRPSFESWNINEKNVLWNEAYITIDFPDMRALKEQANLELNGTAYPFESSGSSLKLYDGGALIIPLPKGSKHFTQKIIPFKFSLNLGGGGSINFIPLGKENIISLVSTWTSPSFYGDYLPPSSAISEEGFTAKWYIPGLARNFPQSWRSKENIPAYTFTNSSFGARLYIPVDTYQKTTRSIKYAILFIILPFLLFFLFEVLSARKIHPFQYLLVGVAVSIFYLLLLSLAEHLAFDLSYIAAAASVTGLIAYYSHGVLKKSSQTILMGVVLVLIYIFLYIILLSEDYALLIGSLGIFAALAIFMIFTRKMDWYKIDSTINKNNSHLDHQTEQQIKNKEELSKYKPV